MAKILLLGARGMLGCRLHGELEQGHEVTATDQAATPGVRALDITDPDAVQAAVQEVRPDWLVNAAAYTAVDGAESEEEVAFRANARGPAVLAEAAGGCGARLLHVSTDFVFDGKKSDAYIESDATGAVGVYARSKEAGEKRVQEIIPDDHVIVRISWLFGPDGPNFVATMLRLGRERDRLGVVDDQRGTPTFTRDAAGAMRRILEADLRGVVHAANQGTTTWCGFARAALAEARITTPVDPIATEDYPTPAPRPSNSALRNAVLERTIGDTMRPWPEALASYISEL